MRKKLLVLFLTAAAALTGAFALAGCSGDDGGNTEQDPSKIQRDGITYRLQEDDTYSVVGLNDSSKTQIIIPSEIDGKSVTQIDGEAFCNTDIESISIPNSVVSIVGFISGCKNLKSIIIPDSVKNINELAINADIETATIPAHACRSIGCTSLKSVTITSGDTLPICAFVGQKFLTDVTIPDSVTSISQSAFEGCTSLTHITIPDSVTSLGERTFFGCTSLTDVTLPDSLTKIEENAFSFCDKLKNITIPDSVETISNLAFAFTSIETATMPTHACSAINNTSLKKVIITGGNALPTNAFLGCSLLTDVTIPDNVTSIGESAFLSCSSLTSITIPNSVTSIGSWAFSGCTSLTDITIPGGVTSICNSTFSGCANLTDVTIPDGVTSIGSGAFYGCSSLTEIELPTKIKSIAPETFSSCGFQKIDIPAHIKNIGKYAFSHCPSLKEVTISDNIEKLSDSAFESCPIESATIPMRAVYAIRSNNLKTVVLNDDGSEAVELNGLSGLTSLTDVTIPSCVTSIGGYAFAWCTSLANIAIPDGVTSIGESAFAGCTSLTDITIPDNLTSIGENAFKNCDALQYSEYDNGYYLGNQTNPYVIFVKTNSTDITLCDINAGAKIIADSAFSGCNRITRISIPANVISIGKNAFLYCFDLNTVTVASSNAKYNKKGNCLIETDSKTLIRGFNNSVIPDDGSVTSIGDHAFEQCSGLTSITIPDSVTSIGAQAFPENVQHKENNVTYVDKWVVDCEAVSSVTLRADTVGIADGAFAEYTSLTSIVIPDSVKFIGEQAFRSCDKLTDVTIGNGMTSIGKQAFYGCSSLTSIDIPNSVTSIGGGAFAECSSLTSITIPDSITNIDDGAFSGCSSLTSITMPNSVTSIGDSAFSRCHSLTSITLPNSVTNISNGAFFGCSSLTSITIPDSVTSIGESAFSSCHSLTSITLPNSVTNISNSAFSWCSALTSITIPDSVTSIGDRAFSGCNNLSSIVIPSSVTEIGEDAFEMLYPITIYCVRTEKPDGWVDYWYGSNTVVWNYYKYISDESCKGEKVSAEEWQQAVSRDNYADENYEATSACWGYVNYNRVDKQDGNKNYGLCVGNGVNADYWNAESYMVTTDSTYTIYSKDSDGWYAFPADYNIMNIFKSTPFKHTPLLCDFSKFTYDEKTGCYVYNSEEFSPIISAEIKFCDGKLAFLQYSEYQDQEFFDQRSIVTRTVNYKYGTAAITLPNV